MNTRNLAAFFAMLLMASAVACDKGTPEHTENAKAVAAFCQEHQIAEAQCPYCDPSLLVSLGHCDGHGVPEALCYQCNPALIPAFKSVGDWCAAHQRPESQCYICNPGLDPASKETPTRETSDTTTPRGDAGDGVATTAPGRFVSRTQQPPSVFCSNDDLIVRFAGTDIADQVGLELSTVESRPVSKTIVCNAELAYDGNRYAHISAQVPGIVAKVHKDFGDRVHPGQALVTIASTALGAAKASYLQAVAEHELWQRNHAREADLLERGVSTERDLLEAETRLAQHRISLSEAKQALLNLGLSGEQTDDVRRNNDTSTNYVVTAPFSGVVVDRDVTIGEVVDPSNPLFAVADVSRMWALIDVYESDLRDVHLGQTVVLHVEGLRGESFGGHITWVSSQLNPRTRTLQARAEFDNARGLLRANMFAQASVSVRDRQQSIVVPKAAVQWEGCCNVVFVKKSATIYESRKVHLGIATGTLYEVLDGVALGEEVVTQGSFLLKTEILKGSIGAGCCEINPGT